MLEGTLNHCSLIAAIVMTWQDYKYQIVDSIMALFRVDFSGRGELADRQQKLAQMLARLQKISEGKGRFT